MASSPPSFDHLRFAITAGRRPCAASPIQAQLFRNGQMKYERTHAGAADAEIVMPDGEIIVRDASDDRDHGAPLQSR